MANVPGVPLGASKEKKSCSSSGSDSSSTGEEERLRRLFQACDEDGDGLIDSHDLKNMCRLLGMEDSAEEIITQLGVHGKISFDEFCLCRTQLMTELEQDRLQAPVPDMSTLPPSLPSPATPDVDRQHCVQSPSWRTSSENSLVSGGGKPESLDYDSGAQDLHLEPTSLQRLIEHHNPGVISELMENPRGQHSQEAATHFLEIANSLHAAALTSLKGEILDLTNRLHHVSSERDLLEKQLNKVHTEKLHLQREYADRLEQQAQRYEERITELHSVIAELRKKLDRHQINVIREEDEYEESEGQSNLSQKSNEEAGSCNENNANDSQAASIDFNLGADLNAELTRVVTELESAINERKKIAVDATDELAVEQYETESVEEKALQVVKEMEEMNIDTPKEKVQVSHKQYEEQLQLLRADNASLQDQIGRQETELNKCKAQMGGLREERDRLRRKVRELQTRIQSVEASSSPHSSRVSTPTKTQPTGGPMSPVGAMGDRTLPPGEQVAAVAKVAELKKLKTGGAERQVLGTEIASLGLPNPKVAEHLAHSLQECSNMQEIIQTLYKCGDEISEGKIHEFEIEMERLSAKIDHLKSQNDLANITLEESKAQCDRLSILIGKYESNNTALQLAINYADQSLEGYQALVDLLETDQGVLLANCRAAGLGGFGDDAYSGNQEEVAVALRRAVGARKSAENMARHLLQKMDRNGGLNLPGTTSATTPWEDMSSTSRTTSTTSSTASSVDTEFSKVDEQRLRDYIQQLKNDRAAVKSTVLELESVHTDPLAKTPGLNPEFQRLDLENAVIMQELMAMKEEKAELKAHNYLIEKELKSLQLRLSGKESQEQAYMVQIDHLKCEIKEQQQKLSTYSNKKKEEELDTSTPAITLAELRSHNASQIAQDLSESLKREKKLKARVQELVATLEKLSRNSEIRHQQSAEFVSDLKRANSALVAAFEKAKKKYQGKVKKLEQQIQTISERYENQVQMLKQKVQCLEEENARSHTSETSL